MPGTPVPTMSRSSCAKFWKYSSFSATGFGKENLGGMLGGVPGPGRPPREELRTTAVCCPSCSFLARSVAQSQKWSSASCRVCRSSVAEGWPGFSSQARVGSVPGPVGPEGSMSTRLDFQVRASCSFWHDILGISTLIGSTLPCQHCQAISPQTTKRATPASDIPIAMPVSGGASIATAMVVVLATTVEVCVTVDEVVGRRTGT
mmetsp:Transcript_75244/g.179657  ORF Transcript_75244/g.179657 Transcript_75244/m.179657 type:complete len:204 (+) Transcript_75244:854-1465(+)